MSSRRKAWLLLAALAASAPGLAAEENDEEEPQATKTFDGGFSSQSGSSDLSSSVSYTVPLTSKLTFSTATALSNGQSTQDNSVSRGRSTSLAFDYDPTSPWRLSVGYANAYSLFHRPHSPEYDEFKTETGSNSISSTLSYDVTDDLKTAMNLGVEQSSTTVIISAGPAPAPVTGRTHSYGGYFNYAVTRSTTISVNYGGSISASDIEATRTHTYPERPPKPIHSRKKGDNLSGTLSFGKDVSDAVSLNLSFNASDHIGRDNLVKGLDDNSLSGNAAGTVTWKPWQPLSFSNTSSLTRSAATYPYKYEYYKQFNEYLFDRYSRTGGDSVEVRLNPSEKTELRFTGSYSESVSHLYDDAGRLPLPKLTGPANECRLSRDGALTSNVDLALGDDITFHFIHNRHDIYYQFFVFPNKDYLSRTNNVDANIGYDWTKNLRVDIAEAAGITLNRYYDAVAAETDDRNNLNVELNTGFYYDVTGKTGLEFHSNISKTEQTYTHVESASKNNARISREFTAKARREFGQLFIPDCTFSWERGGTYFPSGSASNKWDDTLTITPSADLITSDALTLGFSYSYSNREEDRMYNPRPEDWTQYRTYTAALDITYAPFANFGCAINSSNTHSVNVQDRQRRYKTLPAESFFNVSANVNYTF
jgi:hypothetical protein